MTIIRKQKFSIIIPVYNMEKYIHRCIDSILCQDCKDYEMIIVDDGSIDNSPSIIDSYTNKYPYIKAIHQKNQGLVSARKAGINIAQGEYIITIDPDDYIQPYYFDKIIPIIEKYSPDILMFNYSRIVESKKFCVNAIINEGLYQKNDIASSIFPLLIMSNTATNIPYSLWSKVIKKDLYTKFCNIDQRISIGEDFVVTVPCMINANSIYFLNCALYCYTYSEQSITSRIEPLSLYYPKLLYNQISTLVDLKKYDFQHQLYRKTTIEIFNACISQFYSNKSYSDIKKILRQIRCDDLYNTCIINSKFKKSILSKFYRLIIKNEFYLLMYLYSKIKICKRLIKKLLYKINK
ncbi:MAG: glycosyltransferase family 2 protein [Coriobacteriia bacterium]|nr:glycosyltransferase family 2 protein [Coriobacteriia bacterium]